MRSFGGLLSSVRQSKWSLGEESAREESCKEESGVFQTHQLLHIVFTPIKYWDMELDLDFKELKS